jgi:AmiR/NasT family two-component response regulator
MMSVLYASDAAEPDGALRADLGSAGIHCLGAVPWCNLVRQVLRQPPDLLLAREAHPGPAVFEALQALQSTQPLPVLLFTESPDVDQLERGLAAGVTCHVVNGYAAERLRPLAHLAIARFRHQQGLRRELDALSERFEERKLIDRAKGVLMRARRISEDEAFRMLRVASMQTQRRVGQVSQQVIDAARFAEAVNRAGQFRFLGQQLVKEAALSLLPAAEPAQAARIDTVLARGDANLVVLDRTLSAPTYGDLLDAVRAPWEAVKAALRPTARGGAAPRRVRTESAAAASVPVLASPAELLTLDSRAEQLLQEAERLTAQLELALLATPLRVINLCGRQRMLAQRMVKQLLLAELWSGPVAEVARAAAADTRADFDRALAELDASPLGSAETRELLAQARALWERLQQAAGQCSTAAAQRALSASGDELLALFERLTSSYEDSLALLVA